MQAGWGEHGVVVSDMPGWKGWRFRLQPRRDGTVAALEITAPAGKAITPEVLRRVQMGRLRRLCGSSTAVAQAVALSSQDLVPYTPQHLASVVETYRLALSQQVSPRNVIASVFEVSPRTVGRWLGRARQRGMLDTWARELAAARGDARGGVNLP